MRYEEFVTNNINNGCTLSNKTLLEVLGEVYDNVLSGTMYIHKGAILVEHMNKFNSPYGDFLDFNSLSDNERLALSNSIKYMFDKYCINFELCNRKETYNSWDSGIIDKRFIRTEDMMEKRFLMLTKLIMSIALRGLPLKEIDREGIRIKRTIPNMLSDMNTITNVPIGVTVVLSYMEYLDSMEDEQSYITPLYNKIKKIKSNSMNDKVHEIDGYDIVIQDSLFDRMKEYEMIREMSKSILGDRSKVYYYEILMGIMKLCFEHSVFIRGSKSGRRSINGNYEL